MTIKVVKRDRITPYILGFVIGVYPAMWWSITEMDLMLQHEKWNLEVQAMTLFEHRAEFNSLTTASEIQELTDKYFIQQLLDTPNPVFEYCESELILSFVLPSCG